MYSAASEGADRGGGRAGSARDVYSGVKVTNIVERQPGLPCGVQPDVSLMQDVDNGMLLEAAPSVRVWYHGTTNTFVMSPSSEIVRRYS